VCLSSLHNVVYYFTVTSSRRIEPPETEYHMLVSH
jgi:hypothetical protein